MAVAAFPWLFLNHPVSAVASLLAGVPSAEALRALWRDTVQVPLVLGFAAFGLTMSFLGQPFAKMLPSVHTLILRGAAIVGLLASAAITVVHVRAEGIAVGIAAFGFALVLYNLFLMIPRDPAVFKVVRWVLGPGSLLVLVKPALIQWATTAQPLAAACIAMVCSAALLVRGLSPVRSVQGTSDAARALSDLSREEREAKGSSPASIRGRA